jgi:murein DD-endopeptidase MepM/ murein hydrolase activator NlpD
MKRVSFCLAALIVCGTPPADARTAAPCTPKRHMIQGGARAARSARTVHSTRPVPVSLFAGVAGSVSSTARAIASTGSGPHAVNPPLVKQLLPGHLLADQLTQLLGRHPIVVAALSYAKEKWHLPSRLPADGRYTAALIPASSSDSRLQLAYLELNYHGRQERVYHYVDSLGRNLILGRHGEGYRILDPLLPVSDARVSSGWGWRTQPVLGGNEFHQGVDYAAPSGTPVRATMDGTVDLSEWRNNYGRLVEIRHAGELSTRYAHLSAYAPHIKVGSQVHRGQIIGYVGSSGLSTGPHLYYEIWDHGTRIDPQNHRNLMVTASLDARERRRFGAYVSSMAP